MKAVVSSIALVLSAAALPALADTIRIPNPEAASGYYIDVRTRIPHSQYAFEDQPPCGGGQSNQEAISHILNTMGGDLGEIAGHHIIGSVTGALGGLVSRRQLNELAGLLGAGSIPSYSECQTLCAVVPEGASDIDVTPYVRNAGSTTWLETRFNLGPGEGIGFMNILGPDYQHATDGTVICALGMNWSHNLDREIRMVIEYQ